MRLRNPPVYAVPRRILRWKFGKDIEVYRCLTDATILTEDMLRRGECAGHRVTQPVVLSDWEVLKLWLGFNP